MQKSTCQLSAFFLLCCVLTWEPIAWGQSADTNLTIKKLLKINQHNEAYAYALDHLDAQIGDPEFDYYYGLAALESGHTEEALFPLERVIVLEPKNYTARLALGRVYYLLNDTVQARRQFEIVRGAQPAAELVANVDLYLDQLNREESIQGAMFQGYVGLAFGYDSNVNSATDNSMVTLPGFSPVVLNDMSQETSDTFMELQMGGQLNYVLDERYSVYLSGDITGSSSLWRKYV